MIEPRGSLAPVDAELWSLTERQVDGDATTEEHARLETRLRSESSARLFYVAYLDLHAYLQWRMRGEAAPAVESPSSIASRQRLWRSFTVTRTRLAAASLLTLAAGLLMAVLLHHRGAAEEESPGLPGSPLGSVAVLIDNHNAVWEKDMVMPTATGSALAPGRLKLRAGVVEVAFHGGGDVLLEGPAEFDISAADQGFLRRGKLTAKLPGGAPAFRLSMPGVMVTERGGECGLLHDDTGRTEVHVFEGQVGANSTSADPASQPKKPVLDMQLVEKAAARVDADRQTMTPVPFDPSAFAHLRPEVRVTDAAVRGGQFADRNFGTAPRLMVKNSIPDYCWEAYLSFDLSGVKGRVANAILRLVPLEVGEPFDNAAAVVPDNQWGETTVTWNTRPRAGAPFARWTVEQGKVVELDVTPFVQEALAGDSRLTLRIFAPELRRGKSFAQYGSRRGELSARPHLFLTTVP